MNAPATQVEWITKEEAARILDKSERTVLALAAAGAIKFKRERDANKRGQKVTLLHAGDVAALADPERAAERNGASAQVARKPASEPAALKYSWSENGAPPQVSVPDAALQPVIEEAGADRRFAGASVKGYLDDLRGAAARNAALPWLTLNAAAEYSGLTKRWLEDYAAGMLPMAERPETHMAIRDMGKGARGGRWRFLKSDLERG